MTNFALPHYFGGVANSASGIRGTQTVRCGPHVFTRLVRLGSKTSIILAFSLCPWWFVGVFSRLVQLGCGLRTCLLAVLAILGAMGIIWAVYR
jgi:hypothetical protein